MMEELFIALWVIMSILAISMAIHAVLSRDLIKATILMAGVSLIASFLFVLLRAPDVAMAEASIGSALTAIILVLAIRNTKRFEEGGGEK